jgi:hypothetical protein
MRVTTWLLVLSSLTCLLLTTGCVVPSTLSPYPTYTPYPTCPASQERFTLMWEETDAEGNSHLAFQPCDPTKFHFDMSATSQSGHYYNLHEFCIPAQEQYVQEVQAIAKTSGDHQFECQPGHGRIGCTEQEYWCVGFADYTVLCQLSMLDYIDLIGVATFE